MCTTEMSLHLALLDVLSTPPSVLLEHPLHALFTVEECRLAKAEEAEAGRHGRWFGSAQLRMAARDGRAQLETARLRESQQLCHASAGAHLRAHRDARVWCRIEGGGGRRRTGDRATQGMC